MPGDPGLWLTNDEAVRRKYYADKYCTFKFTVSAMGDLIRLIKYSNSPAWFRNIHSDLPIFLVSGENDPVGNYGKGVSEVYDKLKSCNAKVFMKLYSGARHEILNDSSYEQTKWDIVEFANN
jgi:alpha-beta hydrolase superfamily lysophospholipase